jgi:hypothetical protein
VQLFLNQGAGVFGPYATLLPGANVYTAAVEDLNGDGIVDIVAGTDAGAQVLLGTGGGNFENGQTITLGSAAGSLDLADLNGDGRLDLVAAGGNQVSVLLGNGDSTFSSPSTSLSVPAGVSGVLVGDMNGDGYPDLVIHRANGEEQIAVAFNRGDATFGTVLSFAATNHSSSFAIGPLRKPGLIDVVVAGFNSYFLSVLLNRGHGTFKEGLHIPMPSPPGPFAAADFNGDGLTDLAVLTSNGVSIYENSGKGYGPFTMVGSYLLTDPNWIVTADFNHDGIPDLAVSLRYNGIAILLGQGGGRFASPVTLPVNALVLGMIAVGDFNNDGNVDIVATSNQIFFGNGDGTFRAPQPLLAGSFFTNNPIGWITPIHSTGSHYLDLALLTFGGNNGTFGTLINQGNSTFVLGPTSYQSGATQYYLSPAADFNGDGIEDLVMTAHGLQWPILGKGDGTFQVLPALLCGACGLASEYAVTGDFNGDGLADFAVTSENNIEIFLSKGGGAFAEPFMVGLAPGAGFLGYVDMQKPSSRFAFVASSGDGIDLDVQLTR